MIRTKNICSLEAHKNCLYNLSLVFSETKTLKHLYVKEHNAYYSNQYIKDS